MSRRVYNENVEYKRNRHSCYLLQYHLVVVTKYRHPVIIGELKNKLLELTNRIFTENWNCVILQANTDKDHIHILFDAPPQVQLSRLINNYKTVTSRLIRKACKYKVNTQIRKMFATKRETLKGHRRSADLN